MRKSYKFIPMLIGIIFLLGNPLFSSGQTITGLPFSENWDVDQDPLGWTYYTNSVGADITVQSTFYHSADYAVDMANAQDETGDFLLVLPGTELSTSNTQLVLYAKHQSTISAPQSFKVGVMTDPADINTYTNVYNSGNLSSTWTEYVFDLSGIPPQTGNFHIAIQGVFNGTNKHIIFDDIRWEVIPTCPRATDLVVDNITETTANLSWVEQGDATAWNVKVTSSETFDPTTETADGYDGPVSTNPFDLTGLNPMTTYYAYVQANCAVDDLSTWSEKEMFTTACSQVEVFPFSESFEGTYPLDCWSVVYANENGSSTNPMSFVSHQYYQGNQSFRFQSFNNGAPYQQYLITPELSMNSSKIVEFWYKRHNSGTEVFSVGTSTTGNNVDTDFTWSDDVSDATSSEWKNYTMTIDADVKYVAIQYKSDYKWYLYVDEFVIRDAADENDIITFLFNEQTSAAVIDETNHTVGIEVSLSSDLNALAPVITVSDYASINPESGIVQDFSAPFNYTVTSELGTEQVWTINVTQATEYSSEKDIETFTIPEQSAPAAIDNIANTVDLLVDWQVSLGNLTPTITLNSSFASISPESGVVQDFNAPVTYTVTAEDETTKEYTVTVTHSDSPVGANCSNPFIVNIPTALPYADLSQTNCGLGHVYDETVIGSYDNGEDAIYELNVTEESYVKISLDPKTTSWTSLSLFDGCPDSGELIADVSTSSSNVKEIETALSIGTYYVMVDTYASPNCIPEYDLIIEEFCPTPTAIEAVNIAATSVDLQWLNGGYETAWNFKVNEANAIDPETEDGDIVANTIVSTTPEFSIATGLTEETEYFVYIQSDCDSEWVEFSFITPSSCPIPTGLTAINISESLATLTWDELGISNWVIQVSTTPLTDPDTEVGDIANNVDITGGVGTYELSGLESNTSYYWYVKSACGSAWSEEAVFTTACGAFNLPFTENFDDWGTGSDAFPNCWSRPVIYESYTAFFPSIVYDYSSPSSPNSLKFQSSTTDPTYLISPAIAEDINDVMVLFSLKREGNNSGIMEIGVMSDPSDISTFELVQTIDPDNYDWAVYEVMFAMTTLTGENNHIAFKHVSDADNWYYWIDDVTVDLIPNCPKPDNLHTDNITATSASLNWTEIGLADEWSLKVTTSESFDPETETADVFDGIVSASSFELSELVSNTTYYWYVRSNCSAEDLSYWSEEAVFTTACGAFNLPFTENFDDWGTGSDAFPNCWSRPVIYGSNTTFPSIVSYNSSPSSPNSLKFQSSTTDPTYLISPAIAEDINDVMVLFSLKREGTSSGIMEIGVMSDPSDISTFELVQTIDPDNTDWAVYEVMFAMTTLTGENNHIAFKHVSDANNWYYWIDDVTVDLIPNCPKPDNLHTDNITATSASLNWTEIGLADEWSLKVTTSESFDPETETADVFDGIVSASSFELSELVSNTTYYWYVRSNCSAEDLSYWSFVNEFNTPCQPASIFPFTEGFENGYTNQTAVYGCWVQEDISGSQVWTANSSLTSYNRAPRNGSYNAYLKYSNQDWLFYAFELTEATNYIVDLYARQDATSGANITIAYGVNPDVESMTNVIVPETAVTNGDYQLFTGDITPATSGIYYIGIKGQLDYDPWYLSIDDFTVREPYDENDIISFSFPEQTGVATIGAGQVNIEVSMNASLDALTPDIAISDYAEITPASGVEQDFTSSVVYTVTSELGTPQEWTVNVSQATELSDDKDILAFSIPEETAPAAIDNIANTVDLLVDWQVSLENLTPTITLNSNFASISPESGVVQDFNAPVTYTVTAEDETTKEYTVTVTHSDSPVGANCSNPFIVNIPTALPFEDLAQTNCGLGNVYSDTEAGSYDGGEDAIYELNVTEESYVKISLDPKTTSWTSLSLFDGCPDSGELIEEVSASSTNLREIETALSIGTYYVMIDTWPSPDCIPDYDLTIAISCPMPSDIEAVNILQTSADIQWVAGGFETAWNIKVNQANSIDPITEDGNIVANAMVSNTPEYSIESGLSAETEYYVYVQGDCGSDWVEYTFTTITDCPVPTGLTASNIDVSSATLSWDELGISNWVIEISTTALTDPETQIGDIANNVDVLGAVATYNATGLNDYTTYYWYVKSACGSDWSEEAQFMTSPNPAELPVNEDFASGIPAFWETNNSSDESANWQYVLAPAFGSTTGDNGYMRINAASAPQVTESDLITTSIDMSAATENVILTFEHYYDDISLTTATVYISIDMGATWTEVEQYTSDIGSMNQPMLESIDITEYVLGQENVMIRWNYMDNGIGGQNWNIDDVHIFEFIPNTDADILSFDIAAQVSSTIDDELQVVQVVMPNGTDLTALAPAFTLSDGATAAVEGLNQESGVSIVDFSTSVETPVIYTVTAEDNESTSEWEVTVSTENELANVSTFSLAVYPNPNDGQFNLNVYSETGFTYSIFAVDGKLIHQAQVRASGEVTETINLKHVAPGVYTLKVNAKDTIKVEKLIIE